MIDNHKGIDDPFGEGYDHGVELRRQGKPKPLLLARDATAIGYKPGKQWEAYRTGVAFGWQGLKR